MDTGFSLTLSTLLQVNATIIAGVFILLAIGTTSDPRVINLGSLTVPANLIISLILIPFILSAIKIVRIGDPTWKPKEEKFLKSYNMARNFMMVGFIVLYLVIGVIAAFSIDLS